MAMQKRLWERTWTKGTAMQVAAVKGKRAGAPQLYTLKVFLTDGPMTKAFAGKEISRAIQMRGDQTLQARNWGNLSRSTLPQALPPIRTVP